MMEDVLNFDIEAFVEEHKQDIVFELIPEAAKMLSEAVSSDEAKAFTIRMNKIYEEEQQLDENGDLLQIETPLDLLNRMAPNSDGSTRFVMTQAEERWFRANQIYGTNIIGELGFQYEVEE